MMSECDSIDIIHVGKLINTTAYTAVNVVYIGSAVSVML